MGQKIFEDKIGQLTHSAGNIYMAASSASPARLTIGGRQYKITSQLSVALPSMTANTRYQVFAVQSGGVVSLVISQNENSVGPAGYTSWKLVGSLYADGMSPVAFGSFLDIKNVPTSGWISDLPSTQGFGALSTPSFRWKRMGDTLFREATFGATAPAGSEARVNLPGVSATSDYYTGSNLASICGSWGRGLTAGAHHGTVLIESGASFNTFGMQSGVLVGLSKTTGTNMASGSTLLSFNAQVKISGWSNTPIEEL